LFDVDVLLKENRHQTALKLWRTFERLGSQISKWQAQRYIVWLPFKSLNILQGSQGLQILLSI